MKDINLNKEKLLGDIFGAYIRLVSATAKIKLRNLDKIRENTMLGYWHGDSYCMLLLLKAVAREKKGIQVIVTADKRGDVIEHMINHYGAKAIRLPDGLKMRHFFSQLKEESQKKGTILGAALDGPLGPFHKPKKLLFLLALQADKEVLFAHFTYRRVLRLRHRWDKYVIPLPFSKVIIDIEELGKVSKADLANFKEYQKKLPF
ncbi:MAG: DUF374 domain-containing protein [Lachnoclostridium sp.]|jgi:lysophospholipid acyltransferase (LPLAT)-like uncharacterized protein